MVILRLGDGRVEGDGFIRWELGSGAQNTVILRRVAGRSSVSAVLCSNSWSGEYFDVYKIFSVCWME